MIRHYTENTPSSYLFVTSESPSRKRHHHGANCQLSPGPIDYLKAFARIPSRLLVRGEYQEAHSHHVRPFAKTKAARRPDCDRLWRRHHRRLSDRRAAQIRPPEDRGITNHQILAARLSPGGVLSNEDNVLIGIGFAVQSIKQFRTDSPAQQIAILEEQRKHLVHQRAQIDRKMEVFQERLVEREVEKAKRSR
ncbi:hypothetical protein IF1G_01049 [Cordyceps javanica]|uniref:Uncharacterized protein n=1 Tax=Cordyceps javanica TaxID=43265 RepID=A0A545VHA8_9HYPO|nr:hypothetical protein IF1G_01049 [Cordyceps javanica]